MYDLFMQNTKEDILINVANWTIVSHLEFYFMDTLTMQVNG